VEFQLYHLMCKRAPLPPRSPLLKWNPLPMFQGTSYDPETLRVLLRAYDEAWTDIQGMLGPTPLDAAALRSSLAKRITAAADKGERDPRRLKLLALCAIDT
jgi:hypothetical protein